MDDSAFQTSLERLKCLVEKGNFNADQMRHITSKVLARIRVAEKAGMDCHNKLIEHIPTLVAVLNMVDEIDIIENVILILERVLNAKASQKKWTSSLVAHGASGALLHSMSFVAKNACEADGLLVDIHGLLAKMAHKDPTFPMQTDIEDCIRITADLLKKNCGKMLTAKPMLHVVKAMALNKKCSFLLGKEGVIPVIVGLMDIISKKHTVTLKLVFETAAQLTKIAPNARRFVKHGGIPKVFSLLEQWESIENNARLMCKSGLTIASNVAETRAGKFAIADSSGLLMLKRFCLSLPMGSEYDPLLSAAASVVQKCSPKQILPLSTLNSIINFPIGLPSCQDKNPLLGTTATHSSMADSDAMEDDSSSDGEMEDNFEYQQDVPSQFMKLPAPPRAKEELQTYRVFFEELFDAKSQPQFKKCDGSDDNSNLGTSASSRVFSRPNVTAGDVIRQHLLSEEQKEHGAKFLASWNSERMYLEQACGTHHVMPFVKIAFPDLHADGRNKELEALHKKDSSVCRDKLMRNLDKIMQHDTGNSKVVFSLDDLVASCEDDDESNLENNDRERLGVKETAASHLQFESRFESGNLRKVIQVSSREYDLIVSPDVNSDFHHQWFYFEVTNMVQGVPYMFNVINCEKANSQLNFGMKPVIYSVREATLGRPGWVRSGTDICYYRNQYACRPGSRGKTYFTTTFTINFPHSLDVCYIAYHYPYTYSLLKTHLYKWLNCHNSHDVHFRAQTLCETIGGNTVPLLTITSKERGDRMGRSPRDKPIIFLTARVHPGETNSSWVMKGLVDFLLSDKSAAHILRENLIFKIVPILNPDGVINGCHRCSLSAEDLNRCWLDPSPVLHPTVYHTKGLLEYLYNIGQPPVMFCDFHGHSRQKNIFVYGCQCSQSWLGEDHYRSENEDPELFARILDQVAPAFCIDNCSFSVEQNRESTARVTAWRHLGVPLSYTLESSYCGCDQGAYKGFHLGINHLEEMGRKFCQAILHVHVKAGRASALLDSTLGSDDSYQQGHGVCGEISDEDGGDEEAI